MTVPSTDGEQRVAIAFVAAEPLKRTEIAEAPCIT
jgi:hypothetical protein